MRVEGSVDSSVGFSGCWLGAARGAGPAPGRSGSSWSPAAVPAACALSPQCSPWPDVAYQVNSAPSPSYNGSPNSFGLGEGYV